jgi:diguanylate cyclase (GGDEF)-like protein/PAS domain S-box-containing protein
MSRPPAEDSTPPATATDRTLRDRTQLRFFVIAVGLGAVFWLGDALLDHLVCYPGQATFLDALILDPPGHELYTRLFVLGLLIIGSYGLANYSVRLTGQVEQYRGVFSESPDAILLVDPTNGRLVDFNDQACRLLGYTRPELAGLSIPEIDAEQSQAKIDATLEGVEKTGPTRFETRLRTRDGRLVEVEVRVRPLRRQGRPLHISVVTDITERNASARTIKDLNRRITLALETADIGIWEYDAAENRLIWDDAMFRLYGIEPDDFTGVYEAWQRSLYPDDRQRAEEAVQAALAGGRPFDTEFRIVRPNGEVRHIRANAHLVTDEHGKVQGQVGTNFDVTEQRRSEQALRDSEARFRDITETMPGAVFQYLLYPDGKDEIQYASPGCFTIWDVSPEALTNDPSPLWDMVVPEDLDGLSKSVRQSAETGEMWEHEWRIRTRAGQLKRLYGRAFPRYLENNAIFWNTLVIDVTEHREAIEVLNRFFEQPLNLNLIARFDGTILQINRAWATFLGRPIEQLEGSVFLDFVHPDDVSATLVEISQLAQGRRHAVFENRCRDGDGRYRLVKWSASVSTDSGLLYAVAADISAARQAEERLLEAAAVFANTAEGVIITDLNANIRDVNQAFSDITGYEREEAIGRNPSLLQSGRHDPSFFNSMWTALTGSGVWRGEVWNRRKDGSVYPQLLTISTVRNSQHQATGYVGVFSDISTLKETEERLEYLAHHDPLTSLPNRLLFNARLEQSLRYAKRTGAMLAVVFVDIDRFKQINDSAGHQIGDELLKEIAQRLQSTVRADDTVARISGDEFVLILEDVGDASGARHVVKKLAAIFQSPIPLREGEVLVTASIGVTLFPRDGDSPELLLRAADAAMYRAKTTGRNAVFFFSPELDREVFEKWHLERELHAAIKNDEVRLVYQPQVDLSTHRVIGLEALLRWQHPTLGAIPPGRFIPAAEGSGFIRELGAWALRHACAQGEAWRREGLDFGRIAVNVSGHQLQRGDFADLVEQTLLKTRLPAEHLELEVTESFVMHDRAEVTDQLSRLRLHGVLIAIDDFGTDYSSLSRLKQLPIDRLKIDQSFIRNMRHDPNDLAITKTIIAIGRTLGHGVIAEGVETVEHFDLLVGIGCPSVQGYAVARPMETDAVPTWIRHWEEEGASTDAPVKDDATTSRPA